MLGFGGKGRKMGGPPPVGVGGGRIEADLRRIEAYLRRIEA